MAFNLSITQFVVISLSVLAIILGTIFLFNLSLFSKDIIETDLPSPYQDDIVAQSTRIDLTVTPSTSQEGTIFAVIADIRPSRNTQDVEVIIERNGQQIPLTLYDDGRHQDGAANDGKFGALLDSQNFALGTYKIKDSNGNELSEFTLQDSKCQALIGSPAYEKINFLILPYGYANIENFKEDARKIILSRGALFEIEPFKSNFDDLSFSFVEPIQDLECEIGCRGINTMVCCNDARVVDAASQCHYDSLIVLINSDKGCGTASFYTKLCANSGLNSLILAHELGHSFGGLADEYVYSDYFDYSIPEETILEMPNCDVAGCPKWESITTDCYEGCTSPDLYRPSPNSIMRYVSFGSFNEVSKLALQSQIERRTQAESQMHANNPQWKSFYVNLDYSNGEISLSPATVKPVKAGILSLNGYFTANLLDENNNIIYSSEIPLPIIEFPAMEISEKPLINNELTLPLTLPFNPNTKTLEIARNNQILATTSLAIFTDRCGDGVCQSSENHVKCPTDCALENDNFCQSGQCDPDCPNYEQCLSPQEDKNYFWLVLFIALPLLVIAIILFKSRKTASPSA